MEKSPDNLGLEQLDLLEELGYRFVLLRSGEKRPQHKGWQQQEYSTSELQSRHECAGNNIGIKTGGSLIVLDIDSTDPEKLAWVEEQVGNTPMKVQTPSGGVHCYFRTRKGVTYGNKVRLRGEPFDFRHEGAFAVCPPSRTPVGDYHWLGEPVPIQELPIIRVTPLRERKAAQRPRIIEPSGSVDQIMIRAGRYLEKIISISGEGGHNACFRAACRCRDFGLTPEQALSVLLQWNASNAHPPWSEKELRHKITDAYRPRE